MPSQVGFLLAMSDIFSHRLVERQCRWKIDW